MTEPSRTFKTIRMPAADLPPILAALRDPANQKKQGRGRLYKEGKYCCMGIMQYVKSGGVEMSFQVYNWPSTAIEKFKRTRKEIAPVTDKKVIRDALKYLDFEGTPTPKYLAQVGWSFTDQYGNKTSSPHLFVSRNTRWSGSNAWISLIECNDVLDMPFAAIADLIETHTETY